MKLFRDIANINMDFDAVERLELTALGGADTITVGDLTATDLKAADIDLSASAGGGDTHPTPSSSPAPAGPTESGSPAPAHASSPPACRPKPGSPAANPPTTCC